MSRLIAASLLFLLATSAAAKPYEDQVFPFSVEVPADWTVKVDRCKPERQFDEPERSRPPAFLCSWR